MGMDYEIGNKTNLYVGFWVGSGGNTIFPSVSGNPPTVNIRWFSMELSNLQIMQAMNEHSYASQARKRDTLDWAIHGKQHPRGTSN